MPSTPFLIFIGCWLALLVVLYVAGCPSIARDNEQIKEGD